MEIIKPENSYRGYLVQATWSPQVTVIEVLFSVKISPWIIHGVKAANVDRLLWDWPEVESLLWVFDDGQGLKIWQGIQQGPRIVEDQLQFEIEAVIGEYQSATGNVFLGIKWKGRDCPTWELEDDLLRCANVPSDHEAIFLS